MNIYKIGFLILFSFLIIGCQQETNDALNTDERTNHTERFTQVDHPKQKTSEELSNREIANHLSKVASSVPEVNQASALVAGPYTVVAIDLEEDADRSRVSTIKYTVSEALYHDPWGKTAVVVADGDLVRRFQEIGNRAQQGEPIAGLRDELAAIVSRVMPEFPVEHEAPEIQDDNNQMLDEQEEQELEDIQDKQSDQAR